MTQSKISMWTLYQFMMKKNVEAYLNLSLGNDEGDEIDNEFAIFQRG